MPVIVNSISLVPELSSNSTDWLLGNITAKITATINVTAEWAAQAGLTADQEDMVFVAADDSVTWAGGNFEDEGFKPGDDIDITGSVSNNGSYTVVTVVDNVLTVTAGFANETSEAALIEGKTEMTGVNFRYNLPENDEAENYNSKVDGNELKFSLDAIDYTVLTNTAIPQQGVYKSNHLGAANIKGTGTLNNFIITHVFYIHPFFLLDQLVDLEGDIPPSYFSGGDCLKYIYNIELCKQLSDPNRVHASNADSFLLGNTGWFNENFNQGLPKFSVTSLGFVRISDTQAIAYSDYREDTVFTMVIASADAAFLAANTKVIVNHFILPEADSEYKNTATDMTTNFMFDRAVQVEGAAAVNGDNYGTGKQVLKNIEVLILSASTLSVSGTISLSSAYKTRIAAMAAKQFVLSVTVQDHTKQTAVADVVALREGIQEYDTDFSNPSVAVIGTSFNYYPDVNTNAADAGMFVEDTLRGKSIVSVDVSGGATIKKMSVIIRAEKGADSFVLEQKDFSFAGAVVQSGAQMINIDEDRGFILDSTNPFKNLSLKRRTDLDSPTLKKYEIIYPFKIRWEDFLQLPGVNAEFYDITEDFNGSNNDWHRFFIGSGWSIKYVTQTVVEENGFENTVELEKDLFAYTYDEATDWTQTIKVFDIDTNTEIPNNILSDKIVRVEAEFTKISGVAPALADVAGLIEVEPFELGGVNVIRNINTEYIHESGSPFISVLSNKLLKKEKTGSVYKFTANIDGSLLNGDPKLSARIYDLTMPPFGGSKMFQDGNDFLFQDGNEYVFED